MKFSLISTVNVSKGVIDFKLNLQDGYCKRMIQINDELSLIADEYNVSASTIYSENSHPDSLSLIADLSYVPVANLMAPIAPNNGKMSADSDRRAATKKGTMSLNFTISGHSRASILFDIDYSKEKLDVNMHTRTSTHFEDCTINTGTRSSKPVDILANLSAGENDCRFGSFGVCGRIELEEGLTARPIYVIRPAIITDIGDDYMEIDLPIRDTHVVSSDIAITEETMVSVNRGGFHIGGDNSDVDEE